jgi:hypothetical protein
MLMGAAATREGLHLHARRRHQTGLGELVQPGRIVARGHVHLLGEGVVDHVDDELARRLDVAQRVLLAARAGDLDAAGATPRTQWSADRG